MAPNFPSHPSIGVFFHCTGTVRSLVDMLKRVFLTPMLELYPDLISSRNGLAEEPMSSELFGQQIIPAYHTFTVKANPTAQDRRSSRSLGCLEIDLVLANTSTSSTKHSFSTAESSCALEQHSLHSSTLFLHPAAAPGTS